MTEVAQFKYLFTPIKLRNLEIKNRIMSSGHGTVMAENNLPSDREMYYFADRAKGGIGLIVMGTLLIQRRCAFGSGFNVVTDDGCIQGLKRITDAVHEYGTKIFGQLYHIGGSTGMSFYSRQPSWAPSYLTAAPTREIPHVMDMDDIRQLLEDYAHGARNCMEAGFDGVEIQASQGFLLPQFMSPATNQRTDEYGGSLENRLRLTLEVLDKVRETVGDEAVVGIKISGDEFTPRGLNQDDMIEISKILEATDKLDYILAGVGAQASYQLIAPDMSIPPGAFVYLAEGLKEVVNIPIVANARINDPIQAEEILANGHADMVVMCRATICDPEMPNKARQGKIDDIRHCVACDVCTQQVLSGIPISCTQNPAVGREKELGIGTLIAATAKKKVLVIGGGPAGMEAARIAAERGHEVLLYEKRGELGGQVRIAAKVPHREEFGEITRWLEMQLKRLGVEVHVGTEVTPQLVQRVKPDAVVVATGSTPLPSRFRGQETGKVYNVFDVLEDGVDVGDKVIVVDGGEAHHSCYETAEFLADQGKEVEVIITGFQPMGCINELSRINSYTRFSAKHVRLSPFNRIAQIDGRIITVAHMFTGETRVIDNVDAVVGVLGNVASDDLYRALRGKVKEIYLIGDSLAPRKAIDAVREGHLVGREI